MEYFNDVKDRLAFVANSVQEHFAGWEDPNEYNVAEKDQTNALVRDLDREVELYPVVHCWRTSYAGGSQLEFWCKYCKDHHVHGRHSGPGTYVDSDDNVVRLRPEAEDDFTKQMRRLWRSYVKRFQQCTFNDRAPGGRGICTCPMGSGDGHRVAHCWNRKGGYYEHGYILHEVAPDDPRATTRPKRRGRK